MLVYKETKIARSELEQQSGKEDDQELQATSEKRIPGKEINGNPNRQDGTSAFSQSLIPGFISLALHVFFLSLFFFSLLYVGALLGHPGITLFVNVRETQTTEGGCLLLEACQGGHSLSAPLADLTDSFFLDVENVGNINKYCHHFPNRLNELTKDER